jgi:hypothetical protein
MRTKKPFIILVGLLFISTTIVVGINLPNVPVTLKAVYGINSYFVITLSNVPESYDVTNGAYPGWCLDYTKDMPRNVNLAVTLYSYDDPNLPAAFQDNDWNKVLWILNNKDSYSRWDIQYAIWYFINELPWHDVDPNTNARSLIQSANNSVYEPKCGDITAIIAVPENTEAQCTFIELTIPCNFEGLTPGYWKNHLSAWHSYTPSTLVSNIFVNVSHYSELNGDNLLNALRYKGGNNDIGAARILLRSAVAALLNAVDPDINYPLAPSVIIQEVNDALTQGRMGMLDLEQVLDGYNNLGT